MNSHNNDSEKGVISVCRWRKWYNILKDVLYKLEENRSSHSLVFYNIDVLENFANSQDKTCGKFSFLIKLQASTK